VGDVRVIAVIIVVNAARDVLQDVEIVAADVIMVVGDVTAVTMPVRVAGVVMAVAIFVHLIAQGIVQITVKGV
jgi:hypothetical protein